MDCSGDWEDSQYDSIVKFDDSMNPFVQDSVLEADVGMLMEKEVEDNAGMIVQDTFDRDELVDDDFGIVQEVPVVVKVEKLMQEPKWKDDEIVEIIVIPNEDMEIIVIYDDEESEEDMKPRSPLVTEDADEKEVVKASSDFYLNKLPLYGLFTYTDFSIEKGYVQTLRKYQSEYY